jgi:uncharacterized protein with WD repeat
MESKINQAISTTSPSKVRNQSKFRARVFKKNFNFAPTHSFKKSRRRTRANLISFQRRKERHQLMKSSKSLRIFRAAVPIDSERTSASNLFSASSKIS